MKKPIEIMRIPFILMIAYFALTSSCVAPGSFIVNSVGTGSNRPLVVMQLSLKNPYVIIHESDSAW